MSEASYAYAVARRFAPARIAGLKGVDGAEVRLVRHRDVVAAVSAMACADAAALRTRLESLQELEAIARAHHAVVEAVAACSVTLPLRLATVYDGDDRVAEVLDGGYQTFRTALDRLAGRAELGVKVYALAGPEPNDPAVASVSSSSGRDYLHRQRHLHQRRTDARRRTSDCAQQLDASLAALAVDRRYHRPQSQQLGAAGGENILNAAYLVDRACLGEFSDRARRLGARMRDVRVEVSGPWAPYSFTAPEAADGRA